MLRPRGITTFVLPPAIVTEYTDPFIESNFGSCAVTVTTTFGFGEILDNDATGLVNKGKHTNTNENTFQRIQRKSEGKRGEG